MPTTNLPKQWIITGRNYIVGVDMAVHPHKWTTWWQVASDTACATTCSISAKPSILIWIIWNEKRWCIMQLSAQLIRDYWHWGKGWKQISPHIVAIKMYLDQAENFEKHLQHWCGILWHAPVAQSHPNHSTKVIEIKQYKNFSNLPNKM